MYSVEWSKVDKKKVEKVMVDGSADKSTLAACYFTSVMPSKVNACSFLMFSGSCWSLFSIHFFLLFLISTRPFIYFISTSTSYKFGIFRVYIGCYKFAFIFYFNQLVLVFKFSSCFNCRKRVSIYQVVCFYLVCSGNWEISHRNLYPK